MGLKQIFGRPSESKALLRQVLAGVNQKAKGLPVLFVTSQSSSEEKNRAPFPCCLFSSPPRAPPPCFPYFNSPVERIAEASMRSSSRKERSRPAALWPTFPRRSSKAPCACAVLLWRWWGEDWCSPRPMAGSLTAARGKTHMDAQTKRLERGGGRGAGLAG